MGGRGRSSGLDKHRQLTIDDTQRQYMIFDILKEGAQQRIAIGMSGGNGDSSSPRLLKKCACCKEYSITTGTEYETCPICDWIDDPFQNKNPDSLHGQNLLSLVEARKIYQQNKGTLKNKGEN